LNLGAVHKRYPQLGGFYSAGSSDA